LYFIALDPGIDYSTRLKNISRNRDDIS
jgi:hypothetical protein